MRPGSSIAVASCLFLSACAATTVAQGVPALLYEPDTAARAELQQAVTSLLATDQVLLADDALTESPTLIVERSVLLGRDPGAPEHFQLILAGGDCYLQRPATGERKLLSSAECRPAP